MRHHERSNISLLREGWHGINRKRPKPTYNTRDIAAQTIRRAAEKTPTSTCERLSIIRNHHRLSRIGYCIVLVSLNRKRCTDWRLSHAFTAAISPWPYTSLLEFHLGSRQNQSPFECHCYIVASRLIRSLDNSKVARQNAAFASRHIHPRGAARLVEASTVSVPTLSPSQSLHPYPATATRAWEFCA